MLQRSARDTAPPKIFVSSPSAYKTLLEELRYSPDIVVELRSRHVFVSEDLLDVVLMATRDFDGLRLVGVKRIKEKRNKRMYAVLTPWRVKIYKLQFSEPSKEWQIALLKFPDLQECCRTLLQARCWMPDTRQNQIGIKFGQHFRQPLDYKSCTNEDSKKT